MPQTTTFLDLCKRVRQEAGISGEGPSSVTGQTGNLKRVVDWTKAAWLEIQASRQDWLFFWREFTFNTEANRRAYDSTDVPLVRKWGKQDSPLSVYLQTDGVASEYFPDYLDYSDFRATYLHGTQTPGKPAAYTITLDNRLLFGPVPDAIYVVQGECFRDVQQLANNTDIILLDDRYIDVILWRAVMLHAGHEEAGSIFTTGKLNYGIHRGILEREQLPQIFMGGSLA